MLSLWHNDRRKSPTLWNEQADLLTEGVGNKEMDEGQINGSFQHNVMIEGRLEAPQHHR